MSKKLVFSIEEVENFEIEYKKAADNEKKLCALSNNPTTFIVDQNAIANGSTSECRCQCSITNDCGGGGGGGGKKLANVE